MTRRRLHRALRATFVAALGVGVFVPAALAGASAAPNSPRDVRASLVAGEVRVSWAPPVPNGGPRVTSYVVTSLPAKATCRTASTGCTVKGLALGVSYEFHVVARSAGGASPGATSNRVRTPAAGSLYLKEASILNSAVAVDQVAIDNASTPSQLNTALDNLEDSYGSYTSALRGVQWPEAARVDITAFLTDVSNLSTDTVNAYEATSTTAATSFDTLQGTTNAETEADAQVRTALNVPQVITGPLATTSTPMPLGSTQTVHDFTADALAVTVTAIVDPAAAASGSGAPDAGYQFVAVEFNLSAPGGSVGGDANYFMTVTGTDNNTYTANFGAVAECTNFTYGLFELSTGDSASGCVAFQLPASVSVQSVQFSLASGFLDSATWSN